MESELFRVYRAARQNLPPGAPITVLHIGDMETAVVTGVGAEPGKVLILAIGSKKTAREFLHHAPPAPAEIEQAIMQVEDEITRARGMTAGYPSLFTSGISLREIAAIATGYAEVERRISIEAVERVFSLLASYSSGRPSTIAGIPDSPEFAASLLILREFMHHLGFATVSAPS